MGKPDSADTPWGENTISKRRTAVFSAALLAALAVPAIGPTGAHATATDLYVDSSSGSHCTNSGSGAKDAPYCTVRTAADASLPGQTVHVAAGSYPGQLTLTRSGTAEAPITFVGEVGDLSHAAVGITDYDQPGHGLVVSGAQNIRIKGFEFDSGVDEPVVFDHASDVSMIGAIVSGGGAGTAAVRVGTGSDRVTVGGSLFDQAGPAVVVEEGASNTVVTTNTMYDNPGDKYPQVVTMGSPGTIVVSNTITGDCGEGIVLGGASTGAVVENNVVDTGDASDYPTTRCAAGAKDTGVTVAAQAVPDTKVDYNVISPTSGGPAYNWGGTPYTTQAAFTAASGQGVHDFVSDPTIPWQGTAPRTADWVDSADENAPGMLDADAWGWPAKDDPLVPNTGTGTGFRDRGAQEYQSFGSIFTPTGPTRVLDTRNGTGTGGTAAPLKTGGTIGLKLAGVDGVPATGVTAVTMNVTVTRPTSSGVLTVYPHGEAEPFSSNLNWTTGQTVANLVTVPVSSDGTVSFSAGGVAGTVEVIADLAGYYSTQGSPFNPAGPTRLLDTRKGLGAAKAPVTLGHTVDLQVAGVGGVPATGVSAVTLNVTVADTSSAGVLTVYPHGQIPPDTSSLNWTKGAIVPNVVTVPVIDGKVSFYVHGGTGTADIIADLASYYGTDGKNSFSPAGPWRVMDTRKDTYLNEGATLRKAGAIRPSGSLTMPLDDPPVTAAVLNVTVTAPTAAGVLTAYPSGTTRPVSSNLNWIKGQTVANHVIVPPGKDGKVIFYNHSAGSIHLVIDYFGGQRL